MLLAQTKELSEVAERAIKSAEVYGLIGYILIGLLIAFGLGVWRLAVFIGPIVKEVGASTCSLHTCLKESSIIQTARMESQGQTLCKQSDKLSDIQDAVGRIRCPMQNQPNMSPISPSQTVPFQPAHGGT